jgi:hypothetical protein
MADLIVTDGNDVLIDKVEPDPHRLALPVIIVTAVRSLEDVHGFLMPNGLSDSPTTRNAITLANGMWPIHRMYIRMPDGAGAAAQRTANMVPR